MHCSVDMSTFQKCLKTLLPILNTEFFPVEICFLLLFFRELPSIFATACTLCQQHPVLWSFFSLYCLLIFPSFILSVLRLLMYLIIFLQQAILKLSIPATRYAHIFLWGHSGSHGKVCAAPDYSEPLKLWILQYFLVMPRWTHGWMKDKKAMLKISNR